MTSSHAQRSQLYAESFEEALAGLPESEQTTAMQNLLERCRPLAGLHTTALGVIEAFDSIVARGGTDATLSEAAALFVSPQRFREALFFLRCLDRDPSGTLRFMDAQTYVSGAVVPSGLDAGLSWEQASLLDKATFEALWQAPEALADMLAALETWTTAYRPLYLAGHSENVVHSAALLGDVEAARWQVELLEKLNALNRLGEPVGMAALMRFDDAAATIACGSTSAELANELGHAPVCPRCEFRLGSREAIDGLNAALIDIEHAIATQRMRLARHVVRRLTARDGWARDQRLQTLISAIENDNMPVLARVLDEGMLDYLGDLLEAPEPRVNLIDRLAESHPDVTDGNIDSVVAAFRALVADELRRGGGHLRIGREDTA